MITEGEIKRLQEENEQLRAWAKAWKAAAKCERESAIFWETEARARDDRIDFLEYRLARADVGDIVGRGRKKVQAQP
jgi:hypothetical protein